jgi:Phosphodiester glycosidase
VTDLVTQAGAVAGVNASFFTFTASQLYPGTPVGLGIYQGRLLSEPLADPAEADAVIAGDHVVFGKLTWTGSVRNPHTGASATVTTINEPPAASAIAEITPEFAASTPAGEGTEIVLDRRGCVVRTAAVRGTVLTGGQVALQATGEQQAALSSVVTGCVQITSSLRDAAGHRVPVRPGLYAVNGRYRLTAGGEIVVPAGTGSFFDRNPRTIAGTTRDGKIVLATIDGRQTTSVGTTMDETAAVAHALGLRDAINLDGGGSTTMSVRGALINQPSGGTQRPVGDALIWTN